MESMKIPSEAKQAAEKVRPSAFAERPGAEAPWICRDVRRAKALRSHRKTQRAYFPATRKASL